MLLFALIALFAFIIWLVMQFAAGPGWIAKAALIVWMACITLIVCGVNISTN